jgi:rubrerythrin
MTATDTCNRHKSGHRNNYSNGSTVYRCDGCGDAHASDSGRACRSCKVDGKTPNQTSVGYRCSCGKYVTSN